MISDINRQDHIIVKPHSKIKKTYLESVCFLILMLLPKIHVYYCISSDKMSLEKVKVAVVTNSCQTVFKLASYHEILIITYHDIFYTVFIDMQLNQINRSTVKNILDCNDKY